MYLHYVSDSKEVILEVNYKVTLKYYKLVCTKCFMLAKVRVLKITKLFLEKFAKKSNFQDNFKCIFIRNNLNVIREMQKK